MASTIPGRWEAPDNGGQRARTAPDDGEHQTMAGAGQWRAPDDGEHGTSPCDLHVDDGDGGIIPCHDAVAAMIPGRVQQSCAIGDFRNL